MQLLTGTEGDTRPIATLCRALMDAGHEVMLLADGGTLGSARAFSVPHAALAGDIRGALQPGQGIASVVSGKTSLNATAHALARIANENAATWMRQTAEAAASCDALIVSGLTAYVGLSVAERLATGSRDLDWRRESEACTQADQPDVRFGSKLSQ